jgi:hypothetical protein
MFIFYVLVMLAGIVAAGGARLLLQPTPRRATLEVAHPSPEPEADRQIGQRCEEGHDPFAGPWVWALL